MARALLPEAVMEAARECGSMLKKKSRGSRRTGRMRKLHARTYNSAGVLVQSPVPNNGFSTCKTRNAITLSTCVKLLAV